MAENEKENSSDYPYESELETDLDAKTADRPRGMALHTKILMGLLVAILVALAANSALGGSHP